MKKIIKSALLLLCSACMFTACEDDNDSNPVIQSPTTFELNTPAYSSSVIDLATSDSLAFTWSQPDYGGWPAAAEYQIQVSLTNTFTQAYNDAATDATANDSADYVTLDSYFRSTTGNIQASALATALQKLGGWAEGATIPTTTVYVRATAYVPGSTSASTSPTIYSNVVTIKTIPYFVQLTDADPEIWYLIGSCIADGSWGSTIGTQIIPMYTIEGETYDKVTGQGKIQYVGYLTTAGFKLILTPGSWTNQWGQGSSFGTFVKNDGGSGNITVPSNGYYTVTLNTATDELTVEAYTGTVTTYSQMLITGDFNSWGYTTTMNPVSTFSGAVNHDWYYDLDASSGATTAKFTTDAANTATWSSTSFPRGTGVSNGGNIPVSQGSWRVIFNDITGQYTFIAQ